MTTRSSPPRNPVSSCSMCPATMQNLCLVHYHELALKGRNRSVFERQLRTNIKSALRDTLPGVRVFKLGGRECVPTDSFEQSQQVAKVVSLVPGVARVSCALRTEQALDAIQATALEVLRLAEPFTSFKVEARRANKAFPLDSMEISKQVGGWLHDQLPEKRVQMLNMDAKVLIEVIQEHALVYVYTIKGVGGLPVGSAGKVVCLLSAGLDSPVAAWRMMRRGAQVIGLHFSGAPEAADTSSFLVQEIARVLRPAGGLHRLFCAHFGSYQRAIALSVPDKLRVVFYRRMMVAVANELARREGAKALVTGESLGQVASQTLDNIRAVDEVADWPILRPLIGTDKQEIVDEALRLGTYDISIQTHDDCCTLFMPRNPETHAKLDEVERVWAELPVDDMVEQMMGELITLNV